MKSKATLKTQKGNTFTTLTAKVKNGKKRSVVKTKKVTDTFLPIAAGGRAFTASKTVKTKKVYKNGKLVKSK